jgi:hypothetical protein
MARDMSGDAMDRPALDTAALRCLHEQLTDLERRAKALAASKLRHDVGNAVGAAHNALELLEENSVAENAAKLLRIARRNLDLASELLDGSASNESTGLADAPPTQRSARNERNDLRRTGEGDHPDTLGL